MENIINPAEEAANQCIERVYHAIENNQCFRLEAGAGAGKTYTLVKALNFLISRHGAEYLKKNKRIACITYTNVAKDEILRRTDNHPVIIGETIHSFAWGLVRDFQKRLREIVSQFDTEGWIARLEECGDLGTRKVIYDLGYPKVTETEIMLHHDDVIKIFSILLADAKFVTLLSSKYPIILIDEYQDTNTELATSLINNLIDNHSRILIGLFGDHWQKIFGSRSCGLIASENIIEIGKNANFRSDRRIVEALNRIRPELPQNECDPNSIGEIVIYHTNNWVGNRLRGAHWAGDLPAENVNNFLDHVQHELEGLGWEFTNEKTKILMLTNNVLAAKQGYSRIAEVFDSEVYLNKNNDYLSFFIDTVKPGTEFYEAGKYGEMFNTFSLRTTKIKKHEDKISWGADLTRISALKENGTIGEIVEVLKDTGRPKLSPNILEKEKYYLELQEINPDERDEEQIEVIQRIENIHSIPYKEIVALSKYIHDESIYSTNHGVKGEEYENVLVVLGRGWNHYNWSQMLEWANTVVPADKTETYERSRNLFYVACSRPKKRLALLFTQQLSQAALTQAQIWFGNNIIALA